MMVFGRSGQRVFRAFWQKKFSLSQYVSQQIENSHTTELLAHLISEIIKIKDISEF